MSRCPLCSSPHVLVTCVTSRCQSLSGLHHDEDSSSSLHSAPDCCTAIGSELFNSDQISDFPFLTRRYNSDLSLSTNTTSSQGCHQQTYDATTCISTYLVHFVASGFLRPTFCPASRAKCCSTTQKVMSIAACRIIDVICSCILLFVVLVNTHQTHSNLSTLSYGCCC